MGDARDSSLPGSNNTTGKDQCVVIFRAHRALADGESILRLMFKVFDWEGIKVPYPSFSQLSIGRRFINSILMSLTLLYEVASQLLNVFNWSNNSWSLPDKKSSGKYYAFYETVPVDQIKEISNQYDTSYNVAAYAVAFGAMRRLMVEVGKKAPSNMSCFVTFPRRKHPEGLVADVSALDCSFLSRSNSSSKIIQKLSKSTRFFSDRPAKPIVVSWCENLLALLPVFVVKLMYNRLRMTPAFTSFPGPEYELNTMETAKLIDIIPALGLPPGCLDAVGVLVSMAGNQRFVLTMDQVIFESHHVPVQFVKHIDNEVHDLLCPEGHTLQLT